MVYYNLFMKRKLWIVKFEDCSYLYSHDEGSISFEKTDNIEEAYLFDNEQEAYFFTKKFG